MQRVRAFWCTLVVTAIIYDYYLFMKKKINSCFFFFFLLLLLYFLVTFNCLTPNRTELQILWVLTEKTHLTHIFFFPDKVKGGETTIQRLNNNKMILIDPCQKILFSLCISTIKGVDNQVRIQCLAQGYKLDIRWSSSAHVQMKLSLCLREFHRIVTQTWMMFGLCAEVED